MTEMQVTQLKDAVLKAIDVYNKYRSPEAKATLVGVKNDGFVVDFEGSFCETCGVRDYFEDLIYELKGINGKIRVELEETKPTGQQKFRVSYIIKDSSSVKVNEELLFQEFLLDRGMSFNEYLAANSCTRDVIMFQFRTWLFERQQEAATQ